MLKRRTLLLIDDDPAHAQVFKEALLDAADGPFQGEWARTLAVGCERVKLNDIWAIFLNLRLHGHKGLAAFEKVLQAAPGVPTLVLGGAKDKGLALEALKRGAKDYLIEGHIDCYSLSRAIGNMGERETAADTLYTEKARAQVTLDSIGDAVISTDISGTISYLNPVAEKLTGWTKAEALGRPFPEVFNVVDSQSRQPIPNPMDIAIEANKTVALGRNCILIRRDHSERAIEDSSAPIYDRTGAVTGAVIVFHDMDMSQTMVGEMKRLAQHDLLTNLPNRMLLKDRITQAIAASHRNGTQVAVMFIDLDQFKHVNDSLGHSVGDKLLRSVAASLGRCVRSTDTVSRHGGDEFIVLLSEIKHASDAGIMAIKILGALAISHEVEQHHLHVTASIGISTSPEDGIDAESLIKNADTAMYQAKEQGRNSYQFFKKEMNLRAVKRQSLEAGLHEALAGNQFVLHYQPKINLATGAISGVEALVRWMHPSSGLIPPLEFLSVAEDCGLIFPIGRWVSREACRQVQEWARAGLRIVPVAVNVSSLEFRNDGFLDNLRTVLKETGLNPHYLSLEMTETLLMQHAESTLTVLGALKSMGVGLAVDDFGTGYSSLSYLKRFPIDCLKIDQSFVRDIVSGTDDVPIVRAVITMAKSLRQLVVGEGVETHEQMKFLQAHGCDEAQGYYFSRPLVAEHFERLLKSERVPSLLKGGMATSPWLIATKKHSSLN
jgi:diguanylate cyclase (GGDEF)-like protein/PAS domain S-box-containing protein